VYGGTEAGSVAFGDATDLTEDGIVPIGKPVPNADVYICTTNLKLVSTGEFGELCVAGPGVARGYLGLPEVNADRFPIVGFGKNPRQRIYRTGDFARWLPDGSLELAGRADRQVKIRGYRVEPDEIEKVLLGCEGIRETVVTSRSIRQETTLVAYVAPQPETELNATTMRRYLRERLPAHMIPSTYVLLPKLPRTPLGKVDLCSLPLPSSQRPNLSNPYVAPRTAFEETIAMIWADVLELDRVGVYDHFLDLGGDSVLTVQIAVEMEALLGFRPSSDVMLDHQTVASLAAAITSDRAWTTN